MDPTPSDRLGPGAVIGVLGGGQLGRMLAIAAARLGLRARIYAPEPDPPAAEVAQVVRGAYDDAAALAAFARGVDIVTYEFENVPATAVEAIAAARTPVRPGGLALAGAQDRLTEKRCLNDAGVATAAFAQVDGAASLDAGIEKLGLPAILKTRRLGYDGKGQARILRYDDAPKALAAMKGAPAVLEAVVPFAKEVSVIAARGLRGDIVAYDLCENVHEHGVLRRTTVPAAAPPNVAARAGDLARRVLTALDYVGVIGVELFMLADGRLLANEFAPRVHNSGHWTIEACAVDQFGQHVRAICGWPLGDPRRHADAVMENILGEEIARWPSLAAEPGCALHLYGKGEARPGRKMGHVTRVRPHSA